MLRTEEYITVTLTEKIKTKMYSCFVFLTTKKCCKTKITFHVKYHFFQWSLFSPLRFIILAFAHTHIKLFYQTFLKDLNSAKYCICIHFEN